jgi:hypothetical protein
VPILSPSLFRSAEEVETEAAEKKAKSAKR